VPSAAWKRRAYSPVERRRRAAARFALYTSLGVVALAGGVGGRYIVSPALRAREQAWSHVDFAKLPEVRLLGDYVRTDTSPATGNELAGARFLAARLEAAGIHPVLDLVDDRHANLWAIVEGTHPGAVVLNNHLDVTSAKPEEWRFPPFDGAINGPWIRGRGTFDMKSVAIAQLLAFLDVAARPERPARSLIFLATSAEESGSATGMRRVLARHPELVSRFDVVLTEGGALEARSLDDLKYWGIEFAQRRHVPLAARAATREPLDAVHQALMARAHWASAPRLCSEAREFLSAYDRSRDRRDLRTLLADLERLVTDPKSFDATPPKVREVLVDEFFLRPVERDGEGWVLRGDWLLLPDTDVERARREFLPADLVGGVSFVLDEANPASRGSSLTHPAYRALRESLAAEAPDVPIGPYMLGATLTDARFTRALGIPSYGFSPFVFLSIDTYRVDKVDERVGLPGYVTGVAGYRAAVARLVDDETNWN
jgi:acetylornithine deacetylase/succinyl-diaminopimelate desuccinylase-like protein